MLIPRKCQGKNKLPASKGLPKIIYEIHKPFQTKRKE